MSDSLISVIVPVYNSEQTLNRCIDSILCQTYRNFELLLIDDGSNDRSGEICDEYARKDSRVKVFHKENGGVSSARNVGLDNAKGEWITFCDSDDYVSKEWLCNMLRYDTGCDLVVQGFSTPMEYEPPNSEINHFCVYSGPIKDGLILLLQRHILGYLWVKLFKSSIIRNHHIKFDKNIFLQEDELFILSYAKYCNSMTAIEKIGYFYNPPIENKYRQVRNRVYMTKMLFVKSVELYGADNNPIVDYYINYYTDAIVDLYTEKSINRKLSLMEYRKIVGRRILRSRLFPITKFLIYLDKQCILASVFLDIHMIFKKLQNNEYNPYSICF